MQDISRDDFSTLNGGDASTHSTDKDMCPTLICKIQNISQLNSTVTNLPKQINNENNEMPSFVPIKLEDINTIDLFPSSSSSWQKYPTHDIDDQLSFLNTRNSFECNNTTLLLQGSDDPLISHGANSVLSNDDEHPADFAKSLITQANNYFQNTVNKKNNQEEISKVPNQDKNPQNVVKSGCSNLTKQQLKAKANLMSARSQQQKQNQNITSLLNISPTTSTANRKNQRNQKTKNKKGTAVKLRFHHQALPPEYLSHFEATQGQQRFSKNQPNLKTSSQRSSSKTTNNLQKQPQHKNSHENVRSWLQKIAEIQRSANASKESAASLTQKSTEKTQTQSNPSKKCESQNASNCVSTDANNNYKIQKELDTQNTCISTHSAIHEGRFLAEVNNRSNFKRSHYSDLPYMGEITLDNCKPRRGRKPKKADICHLIYKNYGTILHKKAKAENHSNHTSSVLDMQSDCFEKDTYEQPLNLCLRDQLNDSYSISSGDELSETNSTCPTPVSTPFDNVRDSMLANNLKKSLNNINEQNEDDTALNTPKQAGSPASEEKSILPMSVCYQKLLESGVLLHNANGRYKTIKKDNQLALKIPIPNGFFLSHKLEKSTFSPVELNPVYTETLSTPSPIQSKASSATTISLTENQQLIAPQKRKRSAIFIPPMNAENSNNPATEVSICKFKFTGGSKPSLQEKKMISVDAGGNYRYFSGTGDKSSRGYEYFPRESLQQTAGLLPGVNCTGQRLCIDGLSNDMLQISEPTTSSVMLSSRSINVSTDSVSPNSTTTPIESNNINNKSLYGAT